MGEDDSKLKMILTRIAYAVFGAVIGMCITFIILASSSSSASFSWVAVGAGMGAGFGFLLGEYIWEIIKGIAGYGGD